jgi:hypothetical protein
MNSNSLVKKILFLSANPKRTSHLRLDEEMREIKEGLRRARKREKFLIESAEAIRYRDLGRAILDFEPNIVHFSGHGEENGLAVEDETGQVNLISAEALGNLFELFTDNVECVVLNSCYSEVQAREISRHIPFVVGMSKAIGDRAAIEFAIGFYDALGAGRGIEFAYRLGCNAIQMAGISESLTPQLLINEPEPIPLVPNGNNVRELYDRLVRLTSMQFTRLMYELEVPAGEIPPTSVASGERAERLLNWVQSPAGCDLSKLQDALNEIIN